MGRKLVCKPISTHFSLRLFQKIKLLSSLEFFLKSSTRPKSVGICMTDYILLGGIPTKGIEECRYKFSLTFSCVFWRNCYKSTMPYFLLACCLGRILKFIKREDFFSFVIF